jgi:hypothetical protein
MATGISKNFVCLFHGDGEFGLLPGGKPRGCQNIQQFRLGDSGLAPHFYFDLSMSPNVGFFVPFNNAINDPVAVRGKLCGCYEHAGKLHKIGSFSRKSYGKSYGSSAKRGLWHEEGAIQSLTNPGTS